MVGFAFRETDESAAEITRLFDFIWPTAVALWNLRWQVRGFLDAVPNASHEDIASRFVIGSDIRGANIRDMIQYTTWDDQKTRFSEFILTNAFAIYESWSKQLHSSTLVTGILDKDLYRSGDGVSTGLNAFISKVSATPSPLMQRAFEKSFLKHKKVHVSQLNNMLLCYRYFKEVRNCQIHNGGIVDRRVLDAFNEFFPVSSAKQLNTKETIEFFPHNVGDRIKISLRGTVGFCDIILRMMITVDALLSGSAAAERSALGRIRTAMPGPTKTLSSNHKKETRQIRSICKKSGLPDPADIKILREFLLQNRLVGR